MEGSLSFKWKHSSALRTANKLYCQMSSDLSRVLMEHECFIEIYGGLIPIMETIVNPTYLEIYYGYDDENHAYINVPFDEIVHCKEYCKEHNEQQTHCLEFYSGSAGRNVRIAMIN